ncbi:DNA polymerase III subunit alpha [Alphaproteobacteria bacterium]
MEFSIKHMFIPLKVRSDYSLGQSNIKIDRIVSHCVKEQIPAVGICDVGNLFGALEFSLVCSAHGVQPIVGCIVKIAYADAIGIDAKKQHSNHFISDINRCGDLFLIAKNWAGYRNLMKIVSDSYLLINDKEQPHVTLSHLIAHCEGLIILCGGASSPLGQLFTKNMPEYAAKFTKMLLDSYANHDIFIELTRYNDTGFDQRLLEKQFLDTAYKYDIPVVATNPVHYLAPESHSSCDALLCIIENRYITEDDRNKIHSEHYFKSSEEMRVLFSDLPEAIENTSLIAQKCSLLLEKSDPLLPKFSTDQDEAQLLAQCAHEGLEERISHIIDPIKKGEYLQRLEFELEIINKMRFPGYFLVVSDFIKWSKEQSIPVGPGRGSGAGSLVAWALKITEVDPLRFGLLFERFLNPERVSMPDFDIDFCQLRRDEVIQYVRQKYGSDRVAHIITFGKLQARAVLRDVGRVLQMPYSFVDKICKLIPNNPANPITLQEAINLDLSLQEMREVDAEVNKLLTLSLQLEGCYRHVSTHAAGVVIADRPIVELVPLYKDQNTQMPVVQYSMKYAEAAGLMKFDFLGLKTLTVISQTCNLLKTRSSIVDILNISLDDSKTYDMLTRGQTVGVFQFEGVGMREAIKTLKPDCIEDLIALGSLYRPGPMENIPHYNNRKHGLEEIDYIHPELEDVLKETYGIIVYQEQVIQIAQILAGYTLGEADLLRRAMGKKNKQEMAAQREIFVEKAVARGWGLQQAVDIFDLIDKFASYGFNKSHAAAYAIISYQTAYLKANYPLEFLTASINLEIDDSDKISIFCNEAKKLEIDVLSPCINFSSVYFEIQQHGVGSSVKQESIRFGLGGIKNAGIKILESVIGERNKNGLFRNIFDFVKRCTLLGLNKRLLEALAKSGAFNAIHSNAAQIMANSTMLLCHNDKHKEIKNIRQMTLFEGDTAGKNNTQLHDHKNYNISEVNPWNFSETIAAEYAALGFYLTSHPLHPYLSKLAKKNVVYSDRIEAYAMRKERILNIAGVIVSKKVRSTRGGRGGKYAFIQISDHHGIVDVSVFNEEMLYKYADLFTEGSAVFCRVNVRKDDNGIRIVVDSIEKLEDALKTVQLRVIMHIYDDSVVPIVYDKVKRANGNGVHVQLRIQCADGSEVYFKTPENFRILAEDILLLKNHEFISVKEE